MSFRRLVFLGTGAGLPSPTRNVSSYLLQFDDNQTFLFDCGEGTQRQFFLSGSDGVKAVTEKLGCGSARVSLNSIARIFITHLHGDHVFGLPGLLLTLSTQWLSQRKGKGDLSTRPSNSSVNVGEAAGSFPFEPFSETSEFLEIAGPVGIAAYLRTCLSASGATHLGFRYRCTELHDIAAPLIENSLPPPNSASAAPLHMSEAPTVALGFNEGEELWSLDSGGGSHVKIHAAKLQHRILCFGYAVQEAPRAPKLNSALALALGAKGAQLGELRRGVSVVVEGGDGCSIGSEKEGTCAVRIITPEEVLGEPPPIRTALLLGDSVDASSESKVGKPCAFLRWPPARQASVLVHECTFCDAEEELAAPKGHSTARQAGKLARELNVRRLVLTHCSQRYQPRTSGEEGLAATERLEKEAREEFLPPKGDQHAHGEGPLVRCVEDFESVDLSFP